MTRRKRPAPPQNRPSPNCTNQYADLTAIPGHQRHEAPTVEDRADAAVLAAAAERGYRLATQCTACGHWLTSRKSLLTHMGPVCRAKRVAR